MIQVFAMSGHAIQHGTRYLFCPVCGLAVRQTDRPRGHENRPFGHALAYYERLNDGGTALNAALQHSWTDSAPSRLAAPGLASVIGSRSISAAEPEREMNENEDKNQGRLKENQSLQEH